MLIFFFFSSRRRHTRWNCDWSSDVCSSDLPERPERLSAIEDQLIASGIMQHLQRYEAPLATDRSEERRVGKECRSWRSTSHLKKYSRFMTYRRDHTYIMYT